MWLSEAARSLVEDSEQEQHALEDAARDVAFGLGAPRRQSDDVFVALLDEQQRGLLAALRTRAASKGKGENSRYISKHWIKWRHISRNRGLRPRARGSCRVLSLSLEREL